LSGFSWCKHQQSGTPEQQALKGKVLKLIEGVPMKARTSDVIAILVNSQYELAT